MSYPFRPDSKRSQDEIDNGFRHQLCSITLITTLLFTTPVQANAQELIDISLPAGSLRNSLMALANDNGLELVYETELAEGLQAGSLQGQYTLEQTLRKLLSGTDIRYRIKADKTIILSRTRQTSLTTENLLAAAGDFVLADSSPEEESYTGPVEQEDLTVSGGDWSGYNVLNASTATKTDTPILETPVNIQVIPKSVLDDQQTIKLGEAMRNVSGVAISQGSGGLSDDIFLRGFRTSAQFRNGFRFDNQFSSLGTRQMANVERLEVTKGPGAILYGRLEPGGMVNVVTKKPLTQAYYALQQQFGSDDLYRTTVDATGPITDDNTLLYRFNGSFESSGSFRELVDNERTFLAPIVTWNISPQTQITLEMEYRYDRLGYDPQILPFVNGQLIDIPRERNLAERSLNKNEEIFIGLNWSHQFNDDWKIEHRFVADLIDSSIFSTLGSFGPLNPDNTLNRFAAINSPHELNTYYTELNLSGHFNTGVLEHTLLLGGDFYRTDSISTPLRAELNPINVFNPVHNSELTSPIVPAWPKSDLSTDFFGIYAQDQIKLPYGFHVMGGLRYQYVKQWDNLNDTSQPSEDDVTPRVGVLWQAQDWLSVYGNYVENFGASNGWALSRDGNPLSPESAEQWEVGTKLELFDGKFSATLSYFDITKQNVVTPDPVNPNFSIAQGEVSSRGPEVDIRGELMPGWNVIATYANLDTRITKSNSGDQGSRLFAVPRNMGSLWSTYEFLQGDLQGLRFGGGVRLQDGSAGFNTPRDTAGFATVDLLAAYSMKVGKSKVTAQLNVNNLLDKEYITSSFFTGANNRVTFGTPRSFLGSIKVEF